MYKLKLIKESRYFIIEWLGSYLHAFSCLLLNNAYQKFKHIFVKSCTSSKFLFESISESLFPFLDKRMQKDTIVASKEFIGENQ